MSDINSSNPEAQLELAPEIVTAVNAGRKLEAIKLLREEYGMGLVEAKDVVDELMEADVGAGNSAVPAPMRMETGVGRLIGIVTVAAAVAAFFWLFD
jgi:hypothetical protein